MRYILKANHQKLNIEDKIIKILFIAYISSLIFVWSQYPLAVDVLAISLLFIFLLNPKSLKYSTKLIYFILVFLNIYLTSILFSQNEIVEKLLFLIRYSVHLTTITTGIIYFGKKNYYLLLIYLTILSIPIAKAYSMYLQSTDPINYYPLGYGLFSGAKNHYAFHLIAVIILSLFYLRNGVLKGFFISTLIIAAIFTSSATGLFTLSLVLILFLITKINKKSIKLITTKIGAVKLSSLIFFSFSLLIIFIIYIINKTLFISLFLKISQITCSLWERISNLHTDNSFLTRVEDIFPKMNEFIKENLSLFGTGALDTSSILGVYDNTYYAIVISGGITLSVFLFLLYINNMIKSIYLSNYSYLILFVLFVFFGLTANIIFEIQNLLIISIVLFGPLIIRGDY